MFELQPLDEDPVVKASTLRAAYGSFPTGVVAICALCNGEPVGFAASSFVAVSMEPSLVSVCIQRSSTTWPRLAGLPELGISLLGDTHDVACRQLAAKSGDRFAGLDWVAMEGGSVFLKDAPVWLGCSINQVVEAGDHDVVLFRVESVNMDHGIEPLVFQRSQFHVLFKRETRESQK